MIHHESRLSGADTVLIMLPGALMTPQQMREAGLFDVVQGASCALDLIAPNLHAGNDNLDALHSLEVDWLAPARRHYKRVWLGGISRGGHLALSYVASQCGHVDGLCLLAPYAGGRATLNEIERAGGLGTWEYDPDLPGDADVRLWNWLKTPLPTLPIFMGYGEQDRFADGMRSLEKRMPEATFLRIPGGHDWSVWLNLWKSFMTHGHLKGGAG